MKISKITILLLLIMSACSAQENLEIDVQIQQAILALPEDFREGAMVLGYKNASELSILRIGNNAMICIADDPRKDGFNVVGYHKDLEPFMKLGRELKADGKSAVEIFETRAKEIKSGNFNIPQGSILYVDVGGRSYTM